jgi:hypothetical protein
MLPGSEWLCESYIRGKGEAGRRLQGKRKSRQRKETILGQRWVRDDGGELGCRPAQAAAIDVS